MKKYNIAVAILMSLGLVACGSGGGGSSSTTTEPQTATTLPSKFSAGKIIINGKEYTQDEAGQLVPKAEDAQPAESTVTTEQTQPAETAQPVEQPSQATETAQSSEQPQPTTEATQPTEPPAPTEEVVNTPPAKPASSLDNVPEELKEAVREAKKIDLSNEAGEITRSFYASDRPEGVIHEKLNDTQVIRGINQTYSSSTSIYDGRSFWNNEVDLTFTREANSGDFQGLFTKETDLPKGIITYEGKSVGPNHQGNLSLTANFDEKTVQGKITDRKGAWNDRDINLELTNMRKDASDGATVFVGIASYGFNKDYYSGAFAGPHAEEVVGELFKEVKDTSEGAAEGAKKFVTYENFGGKKVE